jgi:hypothetical protein
MGSGSMTYISSLKEFSRVVRKLLSEVYTCTQRHQSDLISLFILKREFGWKKKSQRTSLLSSRRVQIRLPLFLQCSE